MFKKIALSVIGLAGLVPISQARSLYPDLKTATYPLNERSIDTSTEPGKVLLRFSNGVANIGQGRLELRGGAVLSNGTREVYQRIYDTSGGYSSRLAGAFQYHPAHNHVHFNNFASYKLRAIAGTSDVGEILATSEKISFCLIDEAVYNSRLTYYRPRHKYTSCGNSVQGISVGWVDVYDLYREGQTLDVTNVPSGDYWLESTADPNNQLIESDENNNTTRIKITFNNPAINI